MKFFILIMSFTLTTNITTAQLKGKQVELRIGDTLPQLMVTVLSNKIVKKIPLQNLYKQQPIILDFWATWCSPCVGAIAEGDSISKIVRRQFRTVPVSRESYLTIRQFIAKKDILRNLDITYIVSDSILSKTLFKFSTIPHQVWVDTKGVVKAISYADEVTKENIELFVKNQPLKIPEKKDDVNFDFTKPLKVQNESIIYRSLLTPYQEGLGNLIGSFYPIMGDEPKTNRFLAVNTSILNMYFFAYSYGLASQIPLNRIELNVNDSISLFHIFSKTPLSRKKINENTYCYELYLPEKIKVTKFFETLLEELNKFFRYAGSIEKRFRKCWVVKKMSQDLKFTAINSAGPIKAKWEYGLLKKAENITSEILTTYLNWNMDSIPVVNETNILSSFNIELDTEIDEETGFMNVSKINNSLRRKGFELINEFRYVDVLVIREK